MNFYPRRRQPFYKGHNVILSSKPVLCSEDLLKETFLRHWL